MSETNTIIWSSDSYHDSNSRGASLDDTSTKENQDDITNDTIIEDLLVEQEDSCSLDNNQDFINYNHDFDLGVDASTVNKNEECDSKKKNVKDTAVYCGPIQDEQDEMSSLSLESDDDDSIPYQALSPSSMDNYYRQSLDDRDCLGAILPAMESVIRDMVAQELHTKSESMIPTAGKTSDAFRRESQEIDYSMEPTIDMNNTSIAEATNTNLKNVSVNNLGPREQEEAGKKYFFFYSFFGTIITTFYT